jgi:tetratricopeptide (TPR) repeat protein
LVANALQAQQESIRSQDEAIERQERLLQAQRSEINELRTINSDVVEKKRIALQKRGPTPSTAYRTASTRSTDWLPATTDSTMRARMNPQATAAKSAKPSVPPTTKAATQPATTRASSLPPTKIAAPAIAPLLASEDAASDSESSDIVTAEKLAGLAIESDSEACRDAAKEQRAAANADDSSDKLFHLRKALRLCPANAELHHSLGKVYASMNRSSDAKQAFEEALKADPTFSAAKSSLDNLTERTEQRF